MFNRKGQTIKQTICLNYLKRSFQAYNETIRSTNGRCLPIVVHQSHTADQKFAEADTLLLQMEGLKNVN